MQNPSIEVTFQYRYDENLGWDVEDNVSPYISMEFPEENIRRQRFPHEVVIPMSKIQVEYDYPLAHTVTYEFDADTPNGFTRAHLAKKIAEGYQRIYREEDEAVGDPGTVNPMMLNRAKSTGPHGIWGHYIGDLVLHTVTQVHGNVFVLEVDS